MEFDSISEEAEYIETRVDHAISQFENDGDVGSGIEQLHEAVQAEESGEPREETARDLRRAVEAAEDGDPLRHIDELKNISLALAMVQLHEAL